MSTRAKTATRMHQGRDSTPIPWCRMVLWSRASHLSQLLAGFSLLARRGAIRLSQEIRKLDYARPAEPFHLRHARREHMLVSVDDQLRLYFDVHDSFEIDLEAATDADFYFKRSYWSPAIPATIRAKVVPLGLNYEVNARGFDRLEMQRMLAFPNPSTSAAREFAVLLLRLAGFEFGPGSRMSVEQMCASPAPAAQPRVLFMAKAWDPREVAGFSARKAEERAAMNDFRAECIAQLKRRLGSGFYGGFQHTPYASERYPHLLLQDNRLSAKRTYLRLLRDFPICIATGGLHGSIGWKFAEYVAFSKAIVSERLQYELPGDFEESRNYLAFVTPAECVEKALTLIEDRPLRLSLMNACWEYYNGYVRPDAMISRVLETAGANLIGDASGRGSP